MVLMQFMARKRESLKLVEKYSTSKDKKAQLFDLRLKAWIVIGMFKYDLS